ncbi:MAG: DUF433 domain-containing protein [Chloroflexota bacterium]
MSRTKMAAAAEVEVQTEYPHIVRRAGVRGGRPIVQGTRLPVSQIAVACQLGDSVNDLVETYPDLSPAAVHSALAYYWDHKAEIDAEIEANRPERVFAELRRNPNLVEEQPGVFRGRRAAELARR